MTKKTLVAEATPDARYGAALFEGTRLFGKIDTADEAKRVAACWNVCDGISTEVLELNATAGGVATLEYQRDTLLAALKRLNTAFCAKFDEGLELTAADAQLVSDIGGVIASIKTPQPVERPTYHDVVVFAGEQRLRLFDCSYGLQLHCTRSAGWQLWNVWGGKEELLAGEYNPEKPIRIEVRGVVICETKPSKDDEE